MAIPLHSPASLLLLKQQAVGWQLAVWDGLVSRFGGGHTARQGLGLLAGRPPRLHSLVPRQAGSGVFLGELRQLYSSCSSQGSAQITLLTG